MARLLLERLSKDEYEKFIVSYEVSKYGDSNSLLFTQRDDMALILRLILENTKFTRLTATLFNTQRLRRLRKLYKAVLKAYNV